MGPESAPTGTAGSSAAGVTRGPSSERVGSKYSSSDRLSMRLEGRVASKSCSPSKAPVASLRRGTPRASKTSRCAALSRILVVSPNGSAVSPVVVVLPGAVVLAGSAAAPSIGSRRRFSAVCSPVWLATSGAGASGGNVEAS
ncbi:MAG: hypothetical protein HONDAALG_00346 [Gammaproteobacteria bacterium]|nr:hypothetical protein [Gammaproteobacteria bacterium]